MLHWIPLFLSLFLFACGRAPAPAPVAPPTSPSLPAMIVFVSPEFKETEKAGIYAALREWGFALRSHVRITITERYQDASQFIVSLGHWEPEEDGIILGVTSRLYGRMIRLDRTAIETNNLEWRHVMLHEFGHALGADHSFLTLMHPGISWRAPDCIDMETADEVAKAKKWKKGTVHPTCSGAAP